MSEIRRIIWPIGPVANTEPIRYVVNACDHDRVVQDLRDECARLREALREAAKVVRSMAGELTRENCSGCGNVDDEAAGESNDALRYAADELDRLASEE